MRHQAEQTENSRLSGVVAIFPFIGHAGVTEDESDQFGEARLGANIVRQDHDATLTCLDADHSAGGLAVVPAFVETVALRAVEDGDASAREQVLALITQRQVGKKKGEQVGGADMQVRLRHFGA